MKPLRQGAMASGSGHGLGDEGKFDHARGLPARVRNPTRV